MIFIRNYVRDVPHLRKTIITEIKYSPCALLLKYSAGKKRDTQYEIQNRKDT